jgi:DNA mismatch repair protein MutS
LPLPIIERAWQVLEDLENENQTSIPQPDTSQLSLFQPITTAAREPADPTPNRIVDELESTDLNSMTPLQALNFLQKLQETARESRTESA